MQYVQHLLEHYRQIRNLNIFAILPSRLLLLVHQQCCMLVAQQLSLPFVYVRPEPKAHGLGRQVEGMSCQDQSVVLIEDLISTGGSSLRCVEALRQEGARVLSVIAIFNYGLPSSRTAFENHQVSLQTLGNFENLLRQATHSFSPEALASLKAWQENPEAWPTKQG